MSKAYRFPAIAVILIVAGSTGCMDKNVDRGDFVVVEGRRYMPEDIYRIPTYSPSARRAVIRLETVALATPKPGLHIVYSPASSVEDILKGLQEATQSDGYPKLISKDVSHNTSGAASVVFSVTEDLHEGKLYRTYRRMLVEKKPGLLRRAAKYKAGIFSVLAIVETKDIDHSGAQSLIKAVKEANLAR